MALDMYYKSNMLRKIRYRITDDMITTLYQVHNNTKFPNVTWLIDNLYEDIEIYPDITQALLIEMDLFEQLLLSLHLPFPRLPLLDFQKFLKSAQNRQRVIYVNYT